MAFNFKSFLSQGYNLADSLLLASCYRLGFNGSQILAKVKIEDTQKLIVDQVFNLSENPEQHAKLAGTIAMWELYNGCPTTITEYVEVFRNFLRKDVINFLENNAEELQKHINYDNDFDSTYFSTTTMITIYLAKCAHTEEPLEIPQFCWLRIAAGEFCCRQAPGEDVVANVIRIYNRFSNREGIPASPTIFNMGFNDGAPASCMIYTMADSMDDILDTIKEAGLAIKNNAGIGMDFSGLRHSAIGRHGSSQGIIPLLKVWDWLVQYINQGGRRPGALTASNRIHHYDIPEFIRLTDKVGEEKSKANKLNTSLMLCDLFMERVQRHETWTLFCPKQTQELNSLFGTEFSQKYREYEEKAVVWKRYEKYTQLKRRFIKNQLRDAALKEYQTLKTEFSSQPRPDEVVSRQYSAKKLMDIICDMQCKSSMPYIAHGCNINRKNNMCNVGPVKSLNLCQEIAIPAVAKEQTGCCNLASIALNAFVKNRQFQYKEFAECVQDFTICTNQLIDNCTNVSEKVNNSNKLNRPVGLGVNGFSDAVYKLDLTFVDVQKLPQRASDEEWDFVSYTLEAPDYSPDALLERTLNPQVDELNWKIWSCMYYNALWSSKEEAKKFGPYPNFATSPTAQGKLQYHLWQEEERETGRKYPFKLYPAEPMEWGQEGSWDLLIQEIMKYGLRNALLLTCQPTASTASAIGNCESTELPMQNIYTRKCLACDAPIINFHMVDDLKSIGLWNNSTYENIMKNNGSLLYLSETGLDLATIQRLRYLKEKYLTMWEIPQRIMIQLAAQRQVMIDHTQSTNIYISDPTPKQLKMIHLFTWQMGLKTGMYYLRRRAANESLKFVESGKIAVDTSPTCNLSEGCLSCA